MPIERDQLEATADYLRYLTLMAVERAQSGHPGLPLGCAEIGLLVYGCFLNADGTHPEWINRDRFVLSAGHGSMLLYVLNYLFGYNTKLIDIANFRQMGSKTPGHPEYRIKDGVETTTGPLGQGFANAVGLALESKLLASRFNTPDIDLFDFQVYTLMGDGCMMEGLSYESSSLAGHLGLDNLVAIYDSNRISIDGSTDMTLSEDIAKRYTALGWHVASSQSSDFENIYHHLNEFKNIKGKPKLLIAHTVIGEGLNAKKGEARIHGAPAGREEIDYFLKHSTLSKFFPLDEETLSHQLDSGCLFEKTPYEKFLKPFMERRKKVRLDWQAKAERYRVAYPEKQRKLEQYLSGAIPHPLVDELLHFSSGGGAIREMISSVLQVCAKYLPQMVGGSADLAGSTKAIVSGSSFIHRRDFSGRNIAFGVREHAMAGIGNGLALSGMFIPFTATFFAFIDYMRPSVRLAALMRLKHLFIFSHDSIYVGEDGPTHQPVEQLGASRLTPDIYTFRPANDMETAFTFLFFLENQMPMTIVGTRQKIDHGVFSLEVDREALYSQFKKGAYILMAPRERPDIIMAGSGSEVATLIGAKILLEKEGRQVRVVSIPCLERFQETEVSYQKRVLGDGSIPVLLVEAASHRAYKMFYDSHFHVHDMDSFGASGKKSDLASRFDYTPKAIAEVSRRLINSP